MKLKVLQENLNEALLIASRFTSSKSQLPVLANLLISAKKNKITISSTNLEISSAVSMGAKIDEDGETTVPSRVLTEIITNLKPGTVSLTSEKEHLNIVSESFNSVISGLNPSDFPSIPQSLSEPKVDVDSRILTDCLSQVLFAVSSDETRPVLTGVLVIFKKSEIEFVSTDGFRLSKKGIQANAGNLGSEKLIIPKNALSELLRLLSGEDNVGFSFKTQENLVVFGVGNTILSSRVIEGEFPDFEKIIPKDFKIRVNLDKEEFERAVKLASVFAKDSANVVKINVKADSLELSAESSQSGRQASVVDAKIEGLEKEFTIAFNYRFLEEYLKSVKGESVKFELSDANSPGVFLDPKDKDYLHLIMPVKLQS